LDDEISKAVQAQSRAGEQATKVYLMTCVFVVSLTAIYICC
jgi:hypothetical protein